MPYNTGLTATLIFSAGISFTARVRSISPVARFVEALEDTALDASGFHEVVPDDLAKVDAFDVEIFWDGKKVPPLGTVGTITIGFPVQTGQATAAGLSGTGFIDRFETPELTPGVRLMQKLSIQWDGKTGPVSVPAT